MEGPFASWNPIRFCNRRGMKNACRKQQARQGKARRRYRPEGRRAQPGICHFTSHFCYFGKTQVCGEPGGTICEEQGSRSVVLPAQNSGISLQQLATKPHRLILQPNSRSSGDWPHKPVPERPTPVTAPPYLPAAICTTTS